MNPDQPGYRILPVLLLLAATLAVTLPGQADGPEPATAPAHGLDAAWLSATHAQLAEAYGPAFVDVGLVTEPTEHIALLFDGPAPAPDQLPRLHEALTTRAYDISGFTPASHGPIVPVMMLGAQQIPEGIQPGAWLHQPFDCTLAHILQDADGGLHALTAGHCVDGPGDTATVLQPGAPEELTIGTVIAARDQGVGQDFALIEIDPGVRDQVDPAMHGWGGPTGLATAPMQGPVQHYGFGSATWFAEATRCRAGATSGFHGAHSYGFYGALAPGDSGSPSQTADGQALGINTHLGVNPVLGNALGTLATHAIDELEGMTGLELSLVEGGMPNEVCQVV